MTAELIAKLLEYGVLGIICVLFGAVIRVLWNDNKALQRALLEVTTTLQNLRVEDSRATTAQMLRTNSECVAALTAASATLETHREAVMDHTRAFSQLSTDIVRVIPARR